MGVQFKPDYTRKADDLYAALIHLVFVKIHPFQDGNGRIFVIPLIMCCLELNSLPNMPATLKLLFSTYYFASFHNNTYAFDQMNLAGTNCLA